MPVIAKLNRGRPDLGLPRRRRRLRTIQTLPTLLTLGNLICGIAAIHFCMCAVLSGGTGPMFLQRATPSSELIGSFLTTYVSIGAFMIFVGMLFDAMDGRIARFTHRTSNFGGQLDSLADMVTFGVAPAVLMITLLTLLTRLPEFDRVWSMPGRAIWVVAAIYASCTAMRLARFNVEHAEDRTEHAYFHGLPSPGAAAVVASLVILQQLLSTRELAGDKLLANALPYIVLLCSLLMVSSFRYVHVVNRYLKGRRPFEQIVIAVIALGVFLWHPAPTLVVFVCVYGASGPVSAIARRLRAHPAQTPPASTGKGVPEASDVRSQNTRG